MNPEKKELKNQQEPPGNRIKKLAEGSSVWRSVMEHTHMRQIVDDHQLMWFEASEAEKPLIVRRMRRQLGLALVNFAGFEASLHGVVWTFADPLPGALLLIIGIALMRATGKG